MAEYRMRIGIGTLKHLGIGLYSSIPSVLSEAVANAWDADATRVDIAVDMEKRKITIQDDGHGMSRDDANSKYLYVGYERRKRGGATPKGRPVMGRKGIGKLSLFSIAGTVAVHSAKDGEGHGFCMKVKDMEAAATREGTDVVYNPAPLEPAPDLRRGTRITLSDLNIKRRRTRALRRRIARRFGVIGDGFAVFIDGEEITAKDRAYQDRLQYVWVFGERGRRDVCGANGRMCEGLDPDVEIGDRVERIDGWIGTAKNSGQLKDADAGQSINRIAVMARGKVAQEDILEELGEAGVYSKYVVGEIHADFLDADGEDDIATTSRENIKEDDPRYGALIGAVGKNLKIIGSRWTDLRNEEGEKTALRIPGIGEWYDRLPNGHRRAAKNLFGRINRLDIDEREKIPLFVGGVLAFESLKLRNMLDKLERIDVGNMDALREVFLQMESLEASAYYQIIQARLKVIRALDEKVSGNDLEKVIQEHIFDHLWLIDPSWRRMYETEVMERGMEAAFGRIYEGLTDEERKARLDIKYRTVTDRHVIVELKRPDRTINFHELLDQVRKYRRAAVKTLRAANDEKPVDIVCVVGRPLSGWEGNPEGEEADRRALDPYFARIIYYSEITHAAQKAYREYLDRGREVSDVYRLVTQIDGNALGLP